MSRCILVVTDNRFWRASLGSQVRILTLLQHLRDRGFDVQVLFNGRPYLDDVLQVEGLAGIRVRFSRAASVAGDAAPVEGVASTGPRLRPLAGRLRRLLRAMLDPSVYGREADPGVSWVRRLRLRSREPRVQDLVDDELAAQVRLLAEQCQPVAILVEYLRLAWLAARRQHLAAQALWLIDTHDVMHERQRRFHRAGETHEVDVSAREEAAWLSRFDGVLAIQAREAQTLRRIGVACPVLIAPHPVQRVPMPRRDPGPFSVGFLGSDMAPNQQAVLELVHCIWPMFCTAVAGLGPRLVIAGGVCRCLEGRPLPAGVQLLGFVHDLAEFYGSVDVIASPIRFGGGLNIKNVEALSRGKPVVTTVIGAEGLEQAPAEVLRVAESAAGFVDCMLAWARDGVGAAQREELALRFADDHFNANAAFGALDALMYQASGLPARGC